MRQTTERFLDLLQERHLKDLKFGEVTRALRALSAGYVEKREEGGLARALDGRGKRAAFALYYGAAHFLTTRFLVREFELGFGNANAGSTDRLDRDRGRTGRFTILDLGCGTGVCGAAWALESEAPVRVVGVDRSSFALHEARWTYQTLKLQGETSQSLSEVLQSTRQPDGIVIGWTLNELDDERREAVAERILPWVGRGTKLLVIEPVSKRVTPWWGEWAERFSTVSCVARERRLRLEWPAKLALLGRSAGLTVDSTVVRTLTSAAR